MAEHEGGGFLLLAVCFVESKVRSRLRLRLAKNAMYVANQLDAGLGASMIGLAII
jgi:hypothetical protein